MLSEIISDNPNAAVLLIFGGSPVRREEVLAVIQSIALEITAHAVLSEEEGLQMLQSLPQVSMVLIGGRYTEQQRYRIKKLLTEKFPHTSVTEPGWEYPYSNETIKIDIIRKL